MSDDLDDDLDFCERCGANLTEQEAELCDGCEWERDRLATKWEGSPAEELREISEQRLNEEPTP